MTRKAFRSGRIFVGRLPKGVDLVESITLIANDEGLSAASVRVFGEVSAVSLTRFDQETRIPRGQQREGSFTIAAMHGTISQFKRRSLARLSGVFVDADGSIVAGTVALGTTCYACEVVIEEIDGAGLSRDFDMETGLPLWKGMLLVEP